MEKSLSRPRLHSGRRKSPHPHPQPSHPKALYEDVFGRGPRYSVPVLSPRTEDYLEIFGGFHVPSRSCSRVPILDLPVAEVDQVLVNVRCGGFDYSEVFGRVEGEYVGLMEFEVVSRLDDVGGSSYGDVGDDDTWTPEASDWLSEDSEICGYDRSFSNGKPHVSVNGEIEYKMSFHKANHGATPFDGARCISQSQSIPGFSYVVGETPGIEKKVNPHQSKRQTSNSNSHLDYGMERVKGKEQKKVLLHSSSAISRGKSNDDDSIRQKQFGRVKSFPAETFVTISEINLQTAPSNLPPPSRPPPAFDIKTSDARGSTSSCRKNSPERNCLPDYFDVEVDGASSAVASTATMRKAIDEAQSQLKSAEGLMERRKDCLPGPEMSGTKSDPNYMTQEGTLFAISTCSKKDSRFQYDHHRVNDGAESTVTDKSRNIYGENMVSGSDGSAEGILHYVANDVRKEDVIEQVQYEERLSAVVEQEKIKVLLAEHYPKERAEVEDTRESVKSHSKLNVYKPEDGHKEANQQNGRTKLKNFSKNGDEILLNWAVEQKENDCKTVNLSEREEMEKMLKTAFPPEEKKKISCTAYQMEEAEEPNEATKLEHIGNCSLESCRNSSTNESAPEQGTINESLKEAVKYVHTNEILAPKHEKANILERENAGQHEEAVNESDDDIGWEIINEGLCEVVDVRELGFLNQAREKIPVHEGSVTHYSAVDQFDLKNLSNSETRTEALAPQVNGHYVQTDDGFNSATTELTEPMDERASHHSERDLKSKRPGSNFFKSPETVHEEYVYSRLMGSETAVTADQTNGSISCEEEVMEQETVEFKDYSELSDVPLHQGKEISTSSPLNSEFDGGTIGDASMPDLVDGTAPHEEKKEKRAIPEARDNVRLSREQEAELECLRRIEEEKEREKEREKDRVVVDKPALEARERAISEARERFEKATVERATAEASRRAMMEARERLEKACAEARERLSSEKSAGEERLRLERATVERAIAEARGRAAERAKAGRSASDKLSSPIYSDTQHTSSSSDNKVSGEAKSSGSVEVESAQRCRARLERHQRTAERAAKALAEKNMRDLLALREQTERSRLAETLNADVRRWSKGKEGNLRALLSTLQYILGPDSGWQPIPLTEVITLAAMKKAYRKATLCVHPDKLQQRGASIQQKYICEKVFDLLKEGWNKFNSEER